MPTWLKNRKILLTLIPFVLIAGFIAIQRMRTQAKEFILSDPIQRGSAIEAVYGIGTVMATRSYQLKPAIATRIRALYVREGDQVQKGQRLVDLEDTAGVSAPFSGTITYLPQKVGETAFAQSTVLTLTDLSDRYVTVSIEQEGALRVRVGQEVRLSFDSIRDQRFSGIVEAVYSNQDDFLVRIGMKELPATILPGMTADVAIVTNRKENSLLIPLAAVENGAVRVQRNNQRPRLTQVRLGLIDGPEAEVVEGDVQPGDRLLIRQKKTTQP